MITCEFQSTFCCDGSFRIRRLWHLFSTMCSVWHNKRCRVALRHPHDVASASNVVVVVRLGSPEEHPTNLNSAQMLICGRAIRSAHVSRLPKFCDSLLRLHNNDFYNILHVECRVATGGNRVCLLFNGGGYHTFCSCKLCVSIGICYMLWTFILFSLGWNVSVPSPWSDALSFGTLSWKMHSPNQVFFFKQLFDKCFFYVEFPIVCWYVGCSDIIDISLCMYLAWRWTCMIIRYLQRWTFPNFHPTLAQSIVQHVRTICFRRYLLHFCEYSSHQVWDVLCKFRPHGDMHRRLVHWCCRCIWTNNCLANARFM